MNKSCSADILMAKMYKSGNGKGWMYRAGQFCLCLLFLCLPGNGVAAHTIQLVLSSAAAPYREAAAALEDVLARQNVVTQSFTLQELIEHAPASSTDKNIGVWVAVGSRAADHLHSFLPDTIPLIYCMVADPERIGLETGRKIVAGVSVTISVKEQFVLIQKAMPNLDSIGMLYRASSPKSVQTLAEVMEHLPPSWQLEAVDLDATGSMAEAMQELFLRKVSMIWTMADSSIYNRATVKALLLASLRNQIPVFGFSGSFVKAGALLGLEADPRLQGQYAASLVLDVFSSEKKMRQSGATPGVILAVNTVVARRLGISLPDEVIGSAHVIGADQ